MISLSFDAKIEILSFLEPCEIVNPKNINAFRSCIKEYNEYIDFQNITNYTFCDLENSYSLMEFYYLATRTTWNLFIYIVIEKTFIFSDLFRKVTNALMNIPKNTGRTIKIVVREEAYHLSKIPCVTCMFTYKAMMRAYKYFGHEYEKIFFY